MIFSQEKTFQSFLFVLFSSTETSVLYKFIERLAPLTRPAGPGSDPTGFVKRFRTVGPTHASVREDDPLRIPNRPVSTSITLKFTDLTLIPSRQKEKEEELP